MAYCPNCGKEIADGAKFCEACGTQIEEKKTAFATEPVVIENKQVSTPENVSPKSRLCALLLGIFLGALGIHNFYLGKIGKGIVQVLMYIGGFILYIAALMKMTFAATLTATMEDYDLDALGGVFSSVPFVVIGILLIFAVGIWALVEWILIACGKATDKNGLPVTVWTR